MQSLDSLVKFRAKIKDMPLSNISCKANALLGEFIQFRASRTSSRLLFFWNTTRSSFLFFQTENPQCFEHLCNNRGVKTKQQQVTPTLNFNPRVYGDPSASGCRNLIPPEYSGVCSQNLCLLEFAFYIVLFLCCLIES